MVKTNERIVDLDRVLTALADRTIDVQLDAAQAKRLVNLLLADNHALHQRLVRDRDYCAGCGVRLCGQKTREVEP